MVDTKDYRSEKINLLEKFPSKKEIIRKQLENGKVSSLVFYIQLLLSLPHE